MASRKEKRLNDENPGELNSNFRDAKERKRQGGNKRFLKRVKPHASKNEDMPRQKGTIYSIYL
jgi:hypothetical protein